MTAVTWFTSLRCPLLALAAATLTLTSLGVELRGWGK